MDDLMDDVRRTHTCTFSDFHDTASLSCELGKGHVGRKEHIQEDQLLGVSNVMQVG